MKKLTKPQNQIQEVLYCLITMFSIDRRQMMISYGVLNLPEQIRRLRTNYQVEIKSEQIKVVNKYNLETKYTKYTISNKKEAIKKYNSMTKTTLF